MDADDLYRFILANTEEIDGELVCRAAIAAELKRRAVPEDPQQLRIKLVKELERRGVVTRPHPQSRRLIINRIPGRRDATPATRLRCNVEATRQRSKRLKSYMGRNVLRGKEFICLSWGDCESSVPAPAQPLRMVVVGQEVGARGKSRITIVERYGT